MLDYYTLIWKGVSITPQFKTFISFEDLKTFATKTLNGKIENLNVIDKEKTIYYLELKEYED